MHPLVTVVITVRGLVSRGSRLIPADLAIRTFDPFQEHADYYACARRPFEAFYRPSHAPKYPRYPHADEIESNL
jgi:hypothetical protein